MIANFFRKTKPIHAIFISVLFLGYYLLAIFIIEKPSFSLGILLEKVVLLILFLLLFFLIRFINRKNHLSGQNSYVLLLLAIFFGTFPKTMEVQNVFYAHFYLLFSFRRIYSLKTNKNIKEKLFDSGIWVGVASLFYSWSVIFLVLIYGAIIIRKRQEVRNLIIPIIGFITPLFIAFTYYYFIDNSITFNNKLVFYYSFSFVEFSEYYSIIYLSALIVISLIFVSLKIHSLSNDLKASWALIIIHLLIAICMIITVPQKHESFLFLFFPFTIIISNLMQLFDKMLIREIIVLSLLLISISVYFV
jgi:hypothetical protein